MELFNEYRNKSVTALIVLAERIANGEILTQFQFEAEYYRLSGDSDKRITNIFYKNIIKQDKFPIFDFSSSKKITLNTTLYPDGDIHISNIPLKSEKNWLHAALNDRLSKLFLSDEEIEILDSDLSEYPLYAKHIDDAWRKAENITDKCAENFKIILKAINEKKSISYLYKNQTNESIPVKLEYDERTCKIYMIIYDGKRLIKSDISTLSDIKIRDSIVEQLPEIKEEMQKKVANKPIIFTVTDDRGRNALERALLAFSVYDHIVEQINEKTAKFTIQYYSMDLAILIKDILAFGIDIKVESPQEVINEIKKRLSEV